MPSEWCQVVDRRSGCEVSVGVERASSGSSAHYLAEFQVRVLLPAIPSVAQCLGVLVVTPWAVAVRSVWWKCLPVAATRLGCQLLVQSGCPSGRDGRLALLVALLWTCCVHGQSMATVRHWQISESEACCSLGVIGEVRVATESNWTCCRCCSSI